MASRNHRVALIVETSLSSGREILRGIARYAREVDRWELFHGARGLHEGVPDWFRSWKGDGIIARVQDRDLAVELEAKGVPVIDVLGVVEPLRFPLVHVDDERIAADAARHFQERDFPNFAFYL